MSVMLGAPSPASASSAQLGLAHEGWSPPGSTAVDGNTVVTGVVASDGRALGGAKVLLIAWPNEEALKRLPDGAAVDTRVVAEVATDSRGQFAAPLAAVQLGPDHIGINGQVNVELVVADATREMVWNFSVARAEDQNAWVNPRIDASTQAAQAARRMGPVHLSIDIGTVPTVVERGNEPENWIGSDDKRLGDAAAATAAVVPVIPPRPHGPGRASATQSATAAECFWYATGDYQNNRTERFINSIGTIQGKPTVTQTVSSSHSLGLAFHDGSNWSSSGTASATTSITASNFMSYTGSVRNRVNYRRFEYQCPFTGVLYQEWRPHSFYALNVDTISISRPNWTNCAGPYTNGYIEKTQGTNANFSTGVSLTVLAVSAQAQFTNSTKIRWDFSSTGAKLCGSNGFGYATAPEAGAYVP